MPKITRSGGPTINGVPQTEDRPVLLRGLRIIIRDGAIEFSDGTGLPDLRMFRDESGTLVATKFAVGGDFSVPGDLAVTGNADVTGDLDVTGDVGFYGTAAAAKPEITGARANNAALASLLTALENLGLLTDSTTAL